MLYFKKLLVKELHKTREEVCHVQQKNSIFQEVASEEEFSSFRAAFVKECHIG